MKWKLLTNVATNIEKAAVNVTARSFSKKPDFILSPQILKQIQEASLARKARLPTEAEERRLANKIDGLFELIIDTNEKNDRKQKGDKYIPSGLSPDLQKQIKGFDAFTSLSSESEKPTTKESSREEAYVRRANSVLQRHLENARNGSRSQQDVGDEKKKDGKSR